MEIESQTNVPSPKSTGKNLFLTPYNEQIYRANLSFMPRPMIEMLTKCQDMDLPVDDDVMISGLKNPRYLVIVGFASPHTLAAVRRLKKEIDYILIVEPNIDHFYQAVRRYYIGDILQNPRIDFIVGVPQDALINHIFKCFNVHDEKLGSRCARAMNPEIIADPFAYPPVDGKLNPVLKQVSTSVTDAVKLAFNAMGCASDSHYRWERMWENRENLADCYQIKDLFNKFEDMPAAIVCGAGPSLQEFIEKYKNSNIHQRAFIIAVDAALALLLKNGIKPHLVTRCERKFTGIFDSLKEGIDSGAFDISETYYVAYPWAAPRYFEWFGQNKIMAFRDNGVCKWSGYEPGAINGGVSSGNAALEIAFHLGCKRIILAGIDVAFLNNKSHIDGTMVEFDPNKSKKEGKHTQITANDGSLVWTCPVWVRCKNEYQQAIIRWESAHAQVINTSLKGGKIEGTIVQSWSDVDSLFQVERNISEQIKGLLTKPEPEKKAAFEKQTQETLNYLKSLKVELESLFRDVDDVLTTCTREIEKHAGIIKSHHDPFAFFQKFHSTTKGVSGIFREPCRKVDEFKMKHYPNRIFCQTMLDMCQSDLFRIENGCGELANIVELEYERLYLYVTKHMELFRVFHYYTKRLIDMFEGKNDYVKPKVPEDLMVCASVSFVPV